MRRRRVVLFLMLAAAVPLVVASTAWACAALTTLRLDARAAAPGATLSGVGRNYSTSPTASPVTVRFGGRKGPVVWTSAGTPTSSKIKPEFTVPKNAQPGSYVVVATQSQTSATTGQTNPVAGTPGRFPLRVTGGAASRSSAAPAGAWGPAAPGGPGGAGTAAAATDGGSSGGSVIPLSLMSLALLAGGMTLLGRSKLTTSVRPQSA